MRTILLGLLSAAVWTDLRSRKIPNALIMAGLGTGLGMALYRVWLEQSVWPLPESAAGAALPVVLLFLLFRFRMMGAGDIKLFAVIGSWTGPKAVLHIIVCSFLAGGILSLFIMLIRRNFKERLSYLKSYVVSYLNSGVIVPYRQPECRDAEFSFSVPVLIGFLMFLGGL